jgi:hypothetical protein
MEDRGWKMALCPVCIAVGLAPRVSSPSQGGRVLWLAESQLRRNLQSSPQPIASAQGLIESLPLTV